MKGERTPKDAYIKLMVCACRGGSAPTALLTGLDCAVMHARELPEAGDGGLPL